MTDASQPNYPDVLGHITGGARLNVSVVQLALAVRPRVSRAGRPFEAILLIQNASDVDVDVTTTLQIPETDAKKQKKRFIAGHERLVVGLRPAEMGYVVLPLSSLPDTAPSDTYKLGMAVDVKPLGKPRRIRQPEGGGAVVHEYIPDEAQGKINDLKRLSYSTTKRGLVGTVLEAAFSVMGGQIGQLADLKPGWVSLWKMSDYYRDEHLLLDRYGEMLLEKVLPQLKRLRLFTPLLQATQHRFQAGGYPLKAIEARFIVKLLVGILEMAAPKDDSLDYLGDETLNVAAALKSAEDGVTVTLPGWSRAMLRAIDQNEQAAEKPAHALATTLYDELLRDAGKHAFKMLKRSTGVDLGSDADVDAYVERLVSDVRKPSHKLAFTDAYLPLVMGGVMLGDRITLPEEKIGEALVEIASTLRERVAERDEDNELIFKLAEQVIDQALQKYGYRQ